MRKSIAHMLALALMMMCAHGGDGGDTNCDTQCEPTDCPQTECPQTECPQTDNTDPGATCTQDSQWTEGCATQDTQQCDATCSYDGPQVHGGFWDGPCGSDSNGCCFEYRMGPFVYVEPIFDPISLDQTWSSTYVPPRIDQPYGRGSGSDGYGYSGRPSARPDWESHEWQCHAPSIEHDGRECGYVNNPIYNTFRCAECNAERPDADVAPQAARAAIDFDPLSIESPDVEEGAARTGTCCVCLQRVNEVVLLGKKKPDGEYACRHQCMCRQCAKAMRELRNTAARRCPMCRVPTQFFVVADTIPQSAGVSAYK